MGTYLLQATSDDDASLVTWKSSTPDDTDYPGPGAPVAGTLAIRAFYDTPGVASDIPSLSNVSWIDAGTAVPLASRTGSIAAPYGTLAAAITAACTAGADNAMMLCPGDYSGEGSGTLDFTATSFVTHIMGLGRTPIKNTGSSAVVQLPGLTCSVTGSGTLFVERAGINGAITRPGGTVCLIDVNAGFTITCGVFHCDRCYLQDTVTVSSGTPQVTAVEATFTKSGTIISSSSTSLSLTRCAFTGTNPVIAFTGSAGTVTVDAETRNAFFAAGGTITNGTLVCSPQEAGLVAVGYLTFNTSVGTADLTAFTVAASPSGSKRFIVTAIEVTLDTVITGSGNVTIRVGTTTGGNELLTDSTAWTNGTAQHTMHGDQTSQLGASMAVGTGYRAYLDASATIKMRATTAGATISAGKAKICIYGYFRP